MSTLSRVEVATADRVKPRRLPGVDGVWVFIGADSVIFAILFMSFMQERLKDPAVFEASRQTLNMHLGGIDTLILLTSSWSVALAVQAMKRDRDRPRAPPPARGSGHRSDVHGVQGDRVLPEVRRRHSPRPPTPSIMWYFTLTGIHLLHVVVGTSMLTYLWIRSRRGTYDHLHRAVPESVASYWHLVDLLWVVIFPLLYLMKAA